MRDIIELCAQFQSSVSAEAEHLIRDGVNRRSVLEERAVELRRRRDLELSNIDEWAVLQRAMVSNLFESLLDAVRDDEDANERKLTRLVDDAERCAKPLMLAEQTPMSNEVIRADEKSADESID